MKGYKRSMCNLRRGLHLSNLVREQLVLSAVSLMATVQIIKRQLSDTRKLNDTMLVSRNMYSKNCVNIK
jgi:hypothetical protein